MYKDNLVQFPSTDFCSFFILFFYTPRETEGHVLIIQHLYTDYFGISRVLKWSRWLHWIEEM